MGTSCYALLAVYFFQILTPSIYGSVSYDGSVNISEAYSTCSKGWFEYGDMCYKLGGTDIEGGVVWETATKDCKEEKGLLATVYDQDISDFLSAFLLCAAHSSLFIGLDDRVIEGDYKWADGTPYNYSNFEPDEPSLERREEEDCMEMVFKTLGQKGKTGQWNDIGCDYKFPYICQKAKEGQVSKSDPRWLFRNTVHHLDPRYCKTEKGLGWRYEESCFYVVPQKKSWAQAEHHCVKEYKGHLATLDFRVNYFMNYVFRKVTEQMWIGVKIKAETQQKWSSGWLVTFENWAEQEKYVDGTCVSLDASGAWLIQPCDKELWFICEHSTSKAMPPVLKSSAENTYCPKMSQGSQGWRDIGGDFCYFFDVDTLVTWSEGNSICKKRGGTLASFHSQAEHDIVTLLIQPYALVGFYIGFRRPTKNANEFLWVDGSPVNFTRWGPGEPNNANKGEECTDLNRITLVWNDNDCAVKMGYICSTKKTLPPSIYDSVSHAGGINISEVYSTCSKGWFEYGHLCYRVGGMDIKGGVSWETATKACEEEKGHLATVYDQDITDFLLAFLIMPSKSSLWIGLDDRVREGDYKWADGTPYNFTNFRPGEPLLRISHEEDCTEIDYRTRKEGGKMGQWNDENCNKGFPYICQKAKVNEHHLDPRYCETEKGLGWRFEESCFFVVPEKKRWTQAEDHCAKEYKGHLATLDYRVHFFINYVLREVMEEMWIGIKIKAETQQKWSSGWLVSFENWAEQDKFTYGTCVSRNASGAWLIQPCEKELWFICEYSTSKEMPPVLKPFVDIAHCPELPQGSQGWRDLGGDFCYFFALEESVTWYEGNNECMKRGGTLASIHSQAEHDVISLFIRYYFQYWFSIGLYRPTRDANEFVWVDGSPVNFLFWLQDEPNNFKQMEQCTELVQKDVGWRWNDIPCANTIGYICSIQKIYSY